MILASSIMDFYYRQSTLSRSDNSGDKDELGEPHFLGASLDSPMVVVVDTGGSGYIDIVV
jgi:hypothetical protein